MGRLVHCSLSQQLDSSNCGPSSTKYWRILERFSRNLNMNQMNLLKFESCKWNSALLLFKFESEQKRSKKAKLQFAIVFSIYAHYDIIIIIITLELLCFIYANYAKSRFWLWNMKHVNYSGIHLFLFSPSPLPETETRRKVEKIRKTKKRMPGKHKCNL